DGSSLTLTRSLIRFGGLIVSIVALFIGVIWVAFDPKKQGWHDKMAGSIVVRAEPAIFPAHPVTLTLAYPVSPNRIWAIPILDFEIPASSSRMWAIPLVGWIVKAIALVPAFLLTSLAAYGLGLVFGVVWAPVLFTGRYPEWGYRIGQATIRWNARVEAFFVGV